MFLRFTATATKCHKKKNSFHSFSLYLRTFVGPKLQCLRTNTRVCEFHGAHSGHRYSPVGEPHVTLSIVGNVLRARQLRRACLGLGSACRADLEIAGQLFRPETISSVQRRLSGDSPPLPSHG